MPNSVAGVIVVSTKDRRMHVLRAIVTEHVHTNEPVSSKAVAEGHVSGVSSATIRADMGALEREGLIHQPHTSAGRVPTDAGYRRYVDDLEEPQELDAAQRGIVERDLAAAEDLEDAVTRTVRALARLTGQAAIAEYPDLSLAGIRRVEVVDLYAQRLLVLVISTTGRVAERNVELPSDAQVTEELAREASAFLTRAAAGRNVRDVRAALAAVAEEVRPELQVLLASAADAVLDILRPLAISRFATSGASNLARSGFRDVAPILEALEEQATLVRVLDELHVEPVHVSIGAENRDRHLSEASLVSATYEVPEAAGVHVGVLGPTRMDYPRSLAAVRAVSACLTELLLAEPPEDIPAGTLSPKEGTG